MGAGRPVGPPLLGPNGNLRPWFFQGGFFFSKKASFPLGARVGGRGGKLFRFPSKRENFPGQGENSGNFHPFSIPESFRGQTQRALFGAFQGFPKNPGWVNPKKGPGASLISRGVFSTLLFPGQTGEISRGRHSISKPRVSREGGPIQFPSFGEKNLGSGPYINYKGFPWSHHRVPPPLGDLFPGFTSGAQGSKIPGLKGGASPEYPKGGPFHIPGETTFVGSPGGRPQRLVCPLRTTRGFFRRDWGTFFRKGGGTPLFLPGGPKFSPGETRKILPSVVPTQIFCGASSRTYSL